MTVAILIVLAAVWAWVLLPPHLARRRDAHPQSSVVSFRRQLAVLERTGPGSVGTYGYGPVGRSGMSRREARKRRRDIFFTLFAGVVLTLVMAVLMGGSVWILHLSVDDRGVTLASPPRSAPPIEKSEFFFSPICSEID